MIGDHTVLSDVHQIEHYNQETNNKEMMIHKRQNELTEMDSFEQHVEDHEIYEVPHCINCVAWQWGEQLG